MIQKPMTCAEIAQRLGMSLDNFYKSRGRLHQVDKMPRPLNERGKAAYDRASMEAWFTRDHPMRPPAPANDPLPAPEPSTDEEHRIRLARAYAPQRPAAALDIRRRQAGG
ncbi:hypothetical protein [Tardiphaga robiniae]|uniref:hypothetical protein n=1 Tax=Tardiphaga robiniae TaxID=943830 RepID=UPI001586C140|nr:hypothetical protein [Tardiphaga robiniae]NUU41412.1 hypothetical protein [Tardiphaga robiniae]